MSPGNTRQCLITSAVVIGLLVAGSSGATAQQEEAPSVTLAGAQITIDAGETSTVEAEYRFDVESTGSGDQQLTALTGKFWNLRGRSISDLSATVDGTEVSPQVDEQSGHTVVSLPLEDISNGDTVTATLSYQVTGPSGKVKAPMWVPDYPATGEDRVIDIALTLPDGQHVRGDTMPKYNSIDGQTLYYQQLHLPSFISVNYGPQPVLLTTGQLMSLLGVIIILGVFGGWFAYTTGYLGSRRKTNVP